MDWDVNVYKMVYAYKEVRENTVVLKSENSLLFDCYAAYGLMTL